MDIRNITAILSSDQTVSQIAEHELDELIRDYPFASALYALKCQRSLETNKLSALELMQASSSFSHSDSFIDNCISKNVTTLIDQASVTVPDEMTTEEGTVQSDMLKEERVEGEANAVQSDPSHTQSTTNIIPDLSQTATVATEQIEPKGNDHENPIGSQNESSQQELDNSIADTGSKPKSSLLELDHLSDYGSWLLQLKNIETRSPVEEPDSETDEQTPQSSIEIVEKTSTVEHVDTSSRLNDEIASESLAKLLAEQGYRKKAIDMYKKLSLIIPEKSPYFASQIEKIKEK